jgi:YHS domain-containing protein
MVRDRICGTHVPVDQALTLTDAGGTHYFCGSECRERYLAAARERKPVS